jgi:hypothetical protein
VGNTGEGAANAAHDAPSFTFHYSNALYIQETGMCTIETLRTASGEVFLAIILLCSLIRPVDALYGVLVSEMNIHAMGIFCEREWGVFSSLRNL